MISVPGSFPGGSCGIPTKDNPCRLMCAGRCEDARPRSRSGKPRRHMRIDATKGRRLHGVIRDRTQRVRAPRSDDVSRSRHHQMMMIAWGRLGVGSASVRSAGFQRCSMWFGAGAGWVDRACRRSTGMISSGLGMRPGRRSEGQCSASWSGDRSGLGGENANRRYGVHLEKLLADVAVAGLG